MKVLVFGASGFIGNAVATAFVRSGHIVYGQTRSAETAKALAPQEIIPVVAELDTDEGIKTWSAVAKDVDVVVDTTAAKGSTPIKVAYTFRELVSQRPKAAPKPTYIYTGGLWSWSRGPGGLESWTDERQPRTDYNKAVTWRADVEDPILEEAAFNGVVIRPPILYGKSGSFVAYYILDAAYEAGKKGTTFDTIVENDTRWLTIHPDDLGEAYVKVAEVGHLAKGQTLLPANPQSERLTDVLDAVVRVSGAKGWTRREPAAPIDHAWSSTLNAHPSLLHALTGWRPRKLGLVDGIDIYWSSYVASKRE